MLWIGEANCQCEEGIEIRTWQCINAGPLPVDGFGHGSVESVDSLLQWLVREADFRTEAEETLQSVSHSIAATRLMSKPAKSDIYYHSATLP